VSRELFYYKELTPEEEEKVIQKLAQKIFEIGMADTTVVLLESVRPLWRTGTQLGRVFLTPFLPILGDRGDAYFSTFDKRQNVDRLIRLLETLSEDRREGQDQRKEGENRSRKKWWPF